jgi:hypothetical protein
MFVLGLLPFWGQTVSAQGKSISETGFWGRMNQTEVLLRTKLLNTQNPTDDPSSTISQIRLMWEGIDQIRLKDGSSVKVDLGWIRAALTDGQPDSLDALHRQVNALINYHDQLARQTGNAGKEVSQAALAQVLRDPRFQYADITPTPIPDEPQEEAPEPTGIASAAQIILLVAGIAVVIVMFVYFARNLQVQQATIETEPNSDPTTSGDAQNLATDHAQSQDYRSAVRYLYLASLLMLDERGVIHYDSSLTNREHLRHLRDKPQLYALLRQVINAFEEVWYGYLPINESYYQHFRQQVDELNRMVA